jgi:hypothetical protein
MSNILSTDSMTLFAPPSLVIAVACLRALRVDH